MYECLFHVTKSKHKVYSFLNLREIFLQIAIHEIKYINKSNGSNSTQHDMEFCYLNGFFSTFLSLIKAQPGSQPGTTNGPGGARVALVSQCGFRDGRQKMEVLRPPHHLMAPVDTKCPPELRFSSCSPPCVPRSAPQPRKPDPGEYQRWGRHTAESAGSRGKGSGAVCQGPSRRTF